MPKEKAEKSLCMSGLRHAEYYGMQEVFDGLYAKSSKNETFTNLMSIILKRENILLAYRNIKSNDGSKTPGTDGVTFDDIGKLMPDEGKIEWAKNVRVGYLDQHSVLSQGMSIRDVLKSAFSYLFEMEERMNGICDSLGTASPEEMDTLMEELGTIQDTLTMHDFYMIDAKVEEVARALGLLDLGLDKDVTDLSGGQRTKVLMGKLLLEKPDILLLDEPMANLDPVVKTDIWELLIRTIEKENISIIISTHLVEEVNDITDYIGLLDNGRLVKFGDREQILNDDLGNKNKNLRELLEEENG